jgi:hypothetical protein
MSCGIVRGHSTCTKQVFYNQKKFVRIIAGAKTEAFCTELFRKFNILPFINEFLFTLTHVDNREKFQTPIYMT